MKKKLILVLLIITVFINSEPVLFLNEGWGYEIILDKKRWKQDNDALKNYGIPALYYSKESKNNKYPDALIMINKFFKGNYGVNTFDDYIKHDKQKYNAKFPGFKYEEVNWGIKNDFIDNIKIFYISSKDDTLKQYIAFLDSDRSYFISVVLQLDAYGINNNEKYINDFKNAIKTFKMFS